MLLTPSKISAYKLVLSTPSKLPLVVDDHEAILRGVRSLLASRTDGLVCGEARDGVETVEKIKNMRPDLVLMDISMPRMDGVKSGDFNLGSEHCL